MLHPLTFTITDFWQGIVVGLIGTVLLLVVIGVLLNRKH